MIKKFLFMWLAALLLPASALAAPKIEIATTQDKETIILTLPDAVYFKIFMLEKPDRLVLDLPHIPLNLETQKSISLPPSYSGYLVENVRFGQFDVNTSRFVFDLSQPVEVLSSSGERDTLTIELGATKPQEKTFTRPVRKGKPRIVIDPGHGGVDPGTIARDGTREKDLVLQYARTLREKLIKTGRYEAMLTREDDRIILLRERFAIAREHNADLFISLHADSAPSDVRGLSIYTVSENASDKEAEALAARENKSDVLTGMDLSSERPDVAGILISLAQRETNNRSAMFADFLVMSLSSRVRLLAKSHRFAGFAVLKAPDIASVLIELGFLSHREDSKLLQTKSYRNAVTDGIVGGIDAYFRKRKEMERE